MASNVAPFHASRNESFCQELLTSLHGLQQSHTLTDFTIKVGDRSFACHKLILMAACPYFTALFSSGLKEVKNSEVRLESLHPDVIDALIAYFYTGEITVDFRNIRELVEACEFLQCMALKAMCEDYIITNMNDTNVIGFHRFATMYGLAEVIATAKERMCSSLWVMNSWNCLWKIC